MWFLNYLSYTENDKSLNVSLCRIMLLLFFFFLFSIQNKRERPEQKVTLYINHHKHRWYSFEKVLLLKKKIQSKIFSLTDTQVVPRRFESDLVWRKQLMQLIEFVINLSRIYLLIPDIFKRIFKTGFWVKNHLLNLCSSAVNSQRLLRNKKAGAKCLN